MWLMEYDFVIEHEQSSIVHATNPLPGSFFDSVVIVSRHSLSARSAHF